MVLTSLGREDLQSVLIQLDQALYNHNELHSAIVRTLTCRLPSQKNDLNPTAYKKCLFGEWYYGGAPDKLKDHAGFMALGLAHQNLHQKAAHLLKIHDLGKFIDPQEYDEFFNTLERMRLEISTLKHEVEMALYTRDPLTGAINRVEMLPILREFHEMASRKAHVCSLVLLNLDHFKQVNDQYGHQVGDKVLISLVRYLVETIRPYDKIFRYGGDAFLICMQQATLPSCLERIDRIREGISSLPLDAGAQDKFYITASFGVTVLDPSVPIEESIERADQALFEAKNSGRNAIKIWKI